jgi:hypothetical protein
MKQGTPGSLHQVSDVHPEGLGRAQYVESQLVSRCRPVQLNNNVWTRFIVDPTADEFRSHVSSKSFEH